MIVSELIVLLKTFPQDAKIAAFNTTEDMEVVLKGGVVLEEPDREVMDCELPLTDGRYPSYYKGPWVSIVGGRYTEHGWIDGSDDLAEEENNLSEDEPKEEHEVQKFVPSDKPLPDWWSKDEKGL